MKYEIDAAGVELIASFEGFINGAYNDSENYATAGYGHLLHRSPATAEDHRKYDGRGRGYFLKLLHEDIERVSMAPMRRAVHVPLSQHQINALASLAFNCGPGCLAGTVGRKLNVRDYKGAADAFLLWSHPSVLLRRRRQERALFLTPDPHVPLPWLTGEERSWCVEYDRLLRTRKGKKRRLALRGLMHRRAADIRYAAAHGGGWEAGQRRQRYHSLIARSS